MNSKVLLALVTAGISAAAAAECTLVAPGQAPLPIVVSAQASTGTKAVANELAGYLSRMSGAKFAIETGDGSRGVVLGTLGEFPDPALTQVLAITNTYNGREAFAIRSEAGRVRLLGATELGASHAAFRLLEELGCRWFFPAKEWEVVPQRPTLSVALDGADRPRILSRRIAIGFGTWKDAGGDATADFEAWMRHNRIAESFHVNAGHAWQAIIAANRKTFDEHPEYLSLVKGQRGGVQLCVSNPEVRRIALDWALAQLAKNPDDEMVSMECSDGSHHCECAECAKLRSVSDRVFGLANEVAHAVAQKFPGKMVGCLAYSDHSEPPSFALEPNVFVEPTAGYNRGRY